MQRVLAEKIGQMTQVEKNSITPATVAELGIGSVLSGGGGYPRPAVEIVIVGAGAIGMEFASFYRTMGAEVTVVEVLPQILPPRRGSPAPPYAPHPLPSRPCQPRRQGLVPGSCFRRTR